MLHASYCERTVIQQREKKNHTVIQQRENMRCLASANCNATLCMMLCIRILCMHDHYALLATAAAAYITPKPRIPASLQESCCATLWQPRGRPCWAALILSMHKDTTAQFSWEQLGSIGNCTAALPFCKRKHPADNRAGQSCLQEQYATAAAAL
jgi:hypothetical protein